MEAAKIYAQPRVIAVFALGFSSGLPIMLVATTLSTWLAEEGVSKSTIGLFAYVFAPYSLKFAWAPLMDRLPLPPLTTVFGRRRGWLLASQLGLLASIWALGQTQPETDLYWTAVCAVLVAFFSASQDIVVDALRIEILPKEELGAGAGVVVLGYRIAMWVATAGALLIADAAGWSTAYTTMALLVLVGVVTALWVREPEGSTTALVEPDLAREEDLLAREVARLRSTSVTPVGAALFFGMIYLLFIEPLSALAALTTGLFGGSGMPLALVVTVELAVVAVGIRAGHALLHRRQGAPRLVKDWALWALIAAILEVMLWVLTPEGVYVAEAYGWLALAGLWLCAETAVLLFGGSLDLTAFTTPLWLVIMSFWLRFAALVFLYGLVYFDRATLVIFGLTPISEETRLHLWVRRAVVEPFYDFFRRHGVAIAVAILALISVFKASDVILTLMANPFYIEMGFSKAQIAWVSKTFGLWMTLLGGLIGGIIVYRLGLLRSLALAVMVMAVSNLAFLLLAWSHDMGMGVTPAADQGQGLWMLGLFHLVILIENLSGGIGTSVFVAYLSSLCNVHYTAVQYALLTSFMQLFGKFVIVPASGFFVDALGWQLFFLVSALFALPALLLIRWLQRRGIEVEAPAAGGRGLRIP
jgi:PAT family beta-lactamase induction signal transducer AmpG